MIIFAASAAVIKRNASITSKQLMLDYSVWDIPLRSHSFIWCCLIDRDLMKKSAINTHTFTGACDISSWPCAVYISLKLHTAFAPSLWHLIQATDNWLPPSHHHLLDHCGVNILQNGQTVLNFSTCALCDASPASSREQSSSNCDFWLKDDRQRFFYRKWVKNSLLQRKHEWVAQMDQ